MAVILTIIILPPHGYGVKAYRDGCGMYAHGTQSMGGHLENQNLMEIQRADAVSARLTAPSSTSAPKRF